MIRGMRLPFLALLGLLAAAPSPATEEEKAASAADLARFGNRASKVYHRPSCELFRRLTPRAKATFPDAAAARAQGYRPCDTCKPDDETPPAANPQPPADPAPAPTSPAPSDGRLSFARDVAPILVANCARCHNDKDKARRGNFDLSTFAGLQAGGESGPAVVSGKPEESALILRVKGEQTPKMPPGDANLAESAIGKIETWIREGARLDSGIAPASALASYAATPEQLRRDELARMSTSDRDKRVEQLGRERWGKAAPTEPTVTPGTSFLLFSQLPDDRAKALVKALDGAIGSLRTLLGTSADTLASPEKISLFVFNERNAYVEFVRAVENGNPDDSQQAHARLDVESPYIAGVDPLAGGAEVAAPKRAARPRSPMDQMPPTPERSLAGLLAEPLGAEAIRRSGKPPRWLSLGLGAFLGSTLEPRSPYYQNLRAQVARAFRMGPSQAWDMLGDQGETGSIRAAGFGLLEWLYTTRRPAFAPFVREVQKDGTKLDDIIQKGFKATRDEFLRNWMAWAGQRYGSR